MKLVNMDVILKPNTPEVIIAWLYYIIKNNEKIEEMTYDGYYDNVKLNNMSSLFSTCEYSSISPLMNGEYRLTILLHTPQNGKLNPFLLMMLPFIKMQDSVIFFKINNEIPVRVNLKKTLHEESLITDATHGDVFSNKVISSFIRKRQEYVSK